MQGTSWYTIDSRNQSGIGKGQKGRNKLFIKILEVGSDLGSGFFEMR